MFLPYEDMVAILFNGAEPFEQIGNILLTEGPRGETIHRKLDTSQYMNYDSVHDIFSFIFGSVQFEGQCRKIPKWAETAGSLY